MEELLTVHNAVSSPMPCQSCGNIDFVYEERDIEFGKRIITNITIAVCDSCGAPVLPRNRKVPLEIEEHYGD